MKKLLLSLVGILCSMSMWAATVSDLVAINKNYTLIADDVTSNGTVALGKSALFGDNHFLSDPNGMSVATNKGSSTINSESHLNSLRIKNNVYLVFKVSGACHVKVYHQSNSTRTVIISNQYKLNEGDVVGSYSTTTTEADINGAQTVYVYSTDSSGSDSGAADLYIAGIEITGFTTPDAAPTISVPTAYDGDIKHTINVKATVDGSPTPTIQWYSNTTASNENGSIIAGATSSTYQFSPTEAGTYYLYAVATNKMGSATSSVTTITVANAYAATFGKGEVIGTAPATILTAADGKLNIPKNYSLYVAGKTLASWTDGVNEYLPGQQYVISNDIDLTPNFVTNATSLDRLTSTTTVNFIKSTSVAATYQSSNQNAVVEQLTDGGKTIDVALIVKDGKFDLQPSPSSSRAQTNQGTTISIPVIDGAKIVIDIYDNKDDGKRTYDATINEESVEPYLAAENGKQRVMTYTYRGSASYIDYVVNAGNMYAYRIDVTYPGLFEETVVYNWNTVGTTTVNGTATANETVKVKNVSTAGIKFANGLSADNYLKIESNDGGFKAGDVVTFTGVINNSKNDRQGGITIVSNAADGNVQLTCSELFNNTNDNATAASTGSFTLTEDAECLYIGRATKGLSNATTTWLTQLTVSRTAAPTSPILNAYGYATFSYGHDVRVTGAKAYKAVINNEGDKLVCTEIEDGLVPAGEGVLLYGEAGATVTALFAASASAVENNVIKATTLADGSLKDIAEVTSEKILVLSGDSFVPYNGAAFVANKAYIPYNAPAGAKSLRIVFGGQTTGINTVSAQKVANAKFIENGRIVIVKDGAKYNVAGQVIK